MATNQSTPAEQPSADDVNHEVDPASEPVKLTASERLDEAHGIVQNNIYWAMGAGVLPFPVFDLIAITGVQLKMLRQLSSHYDIPFREGLAKKAVTSLLVGLGGVGIGGIIGASLFKSLPVLGTSLGVVSIPVISGMLTHAVGRTFIMHFESGGTLLDFDPGDMRDYFRQEFSDSKGKVTQMKSEETVSAKSASA